VVQARFRRRIEGRLRGGIVTCLSNVSLYAKAKGKHEWEMAQEIWIFPCVSIDR
jgi:hypothetical protein